MSDPFNGRAYEVQFTREGVWLRFPPNGGWHRGSSLADVIAAERYSTIHRNTRTPAPPDARGER